MNKSESIAKIAFALSKAQSTIKGAVKDSNNPHFNSKFADLESVIDAIQDALTENEIAYPQFSTIIDSKPYLTTMLVHSSGEWMSGDYPLLCKDPTDPQKLLAAMTYARRGCLSAAVGLKQIDDDGNTAAKCADKPKAQEKTKDTPKVIQPKTPAGPPSLVSVAQVARLWAIQRNSDKSIAEVMAKMKEKYQITEAEKLTFVPYNEIIKWIESK